MDPDEQSTFRFSNLFTELFPLVRRQIGRSPAHTPFAASELGAQHDDEDSERRYPARQGFMQTSLPQNLSNEQFGEYLDMYPMYIRDVYQNAERERFDLIPERLEQRDPKFFTKEELTYMDQWMQKRGTLMNIEAHLRNAKLINKNRGRNVEDVTRRAIQKYDEGPGSIAQILQAMRILTELKGVELSRASLLLSVVYPDTLPFFSKDIYRWIHWDEESGWAQDFIWTPDKYEDTLQQVASLRKKYSVNGAIARAVDVEKVVFVLKHGSIINGLRNKSITDALIPNKKRYSGVGHAKVYKADRTNLDGKHGEVAIKRIAKGADVEIARNRFLSEIAASSHLAKLSPQYFVEFLGWNEDVDNLFIALEYVEFGDLEENLKKSLWNEGDIKETATQILNGLKVMHGEGIAHRDLKPQNILVVSNQPGNTMVKITDFGVAKRLSNRKTTALVTRCIGTAGYKAPEVVEYWEAEDDTNQRVNIDSRHSYTFKADLWSLGCIIFRMAKGKPLFTSDTDLTNRNHLKRQVGAIAERLAVDSAVGQQGAEFVRQLIVIKEKNRHDAESALEALDSWGIFGDERSAANQKGGR
ncbi:kinase-like protein [Hypomontagnella monticulosa]|nr:kinase-like protein [Hypomontagnella monticulosa]